MAERFHLIAPICSSGWRYLIDPRAAAAGCLNRSIQKPRGMNTRGPAGHQSPLCVCQLMLQTSAYWQKPLPRVANSL